MYERDAILKDLRDNVIEVTFTKVSGDQRVMRCTLKPSLLPATYATEITEEKKHHKENPDVIAAWDVVKGGWRSFRVDSISYVQVIDAY
jgi:hypothetical protein